MIEMRVAGQCQDALGAQPWQLRQQVNNPESTVDHQVVLATLHVPDIAAIKRVDVLLEDVSDTVAHALVAIPVGGAGGLECSGTRAAHSAPPRSGVAAADVSELASVLRTLRTGSIGTATQGNQRGPAGPNTAHGSGNTRSSEG